MTLNELKEYVAASPNKAWLQNYKLKINYKNINYKNDLVGVINIYSFVTDQSEGFSKVSSLPDELKEIQQKFVIAKHNLLQLISQANVNPSGWDNNLRGISGSNNQPFFLYDSPEAEFLMKVHRERREFYRGAYEYLSGTIQQASNKDYLAGCIMAYEFTSKDFSLIAERKDAEKKSISSVRTDFQTRLGEAEIQMTEYLAKAHQKFVEYSKNIDELKTQKETTYNEWFSKTTKGFSDFNTSSNQKIKDLEDLYQDKLKLKAPARYWNDRAKKLRKEGYGWLVALIASIAAGAGVLIWVLNEIAAGTFEKIFKDTGTAVKWSVAIITLISFLAYAIRVLSKLTFSSFHLVRDAEEREQLTYVYLALQNEKSVDQTERHLIMQSLFSRADTGLLRDDAAPTMPGNIADQFTKK